MKENSSPILQHLVIERILEEKLKEELKDALKQKGKDNLFNKYFQSLVWTEKLPESLKEGGELLQIAKEIAKEGAEFMKQFFERIEKEIKAGL